MRTPPSSNQVFNNADSFALAFDEAWKRHSHLHPDHGLSSEEKVDLIFEQISDRIGKLRSAGFGPIARQRQ